MKPYLYRQMLTLGAVVALASCSNEDFSPDGGDVAPGGSSGRICFVVNNQSASRGGSDSGLRRDDAVLSRPDGVLLLDPDGSDSLYLAASVEDQPDIQASRASVATGYPGLRMTCLRRISGSEYKYYFSNVEYTKDASGTWVSDPEYWWLDANSHFSFYGYAPSDARGVTYISDALSWQPKVDYTVPTDVAEQCDLAYNTLTREYIANENKTVPLSMKHALANIAFRTGSGMAAGRINRVTVRNVLGHGTLNLATGEWTLDRNSATDFSIALRQSSADNTDITSDGTFLMLLPGCTTDQSSLEIDFTKADGTTATFSGSLPASTDWQAGKQYRYTVSIDPDLSIELENPDPKDAHYVMCKATVKAANMQPDRQWQLTVTADDGADVSVLADANLSQYHNSGFWIGYSIDENGTRTRIRGTSTLTGYGDTPVTVFLPENVGNRNRTVTLTLKVAGSGSRVVSSQTLTQLHPAWTSGSFGWEQLDDPRLGQWGFFSSARKVYVYNYSHPNYTTALNNVKELIVSLITQYDASDYVDYDKYRQGALQYRYYVAINYGNIINLGNLSSSGTDGLTNTRELYRHGGTAYSNEFEDALLAAKKTENNTQAFVPRRDTDPDEVPLSIVDNSITDPILTTILKKNRYYLNIYTDPNTGVKTEAPRIKEEDIVWYLPAREQFNTMPSEIIDPINPGDHWSSTATSTDNAQAWLGNSSLALRTSFHKIRACRTRP